MTLIATETYVRLTGDSTSSDTVITQALADAQALVEEELNRALESGERTEILPVIDGHVYPSVVPITVSDFTIEDYSITDLSGDLISEPFDPINPRMEITYTGGYTEETLPFRLKQAICKTAHRMLHSTPVLESAVPVGAQSVRVGDVSVTYGSGGAGATIGALTASVMADIRPYRRMEP